LAFFTYIVASKRNGTLYTGSTDDVVTRAYQHRDKVRPSSFSARHGVTMLVWYEIHETRGSRLPPRTTDQEMEPAVEAEAHRRDEPRLA